MTISFENSLVSYNKIYHQLKRGYKNNINLVFPVPQTVAWFGNVICLWSTLLMDARRTQGRKVLCMLLLLAFFPQFVVRVFLDSNDNTVCRSPWCDFLLFSFWIYIYMSNARDHLFLHPVCSRCLEDLLNAKFVV